MEDMIPGDDVAASSLDDGIGADGQELITNDYHEPGDDAVSYIDMDDEQLEGCGGDENENDDDDNSQDEENDVPSKVVIKPKAPVDHGPLAFVKKDVQQEVAEVYQAQPDLDLSLDVEDTEMQRELNALNLEDEVLVDVLENSDLKMNNSPEIKMDSITKSIEDAKRAIR